MDLHCAHDRKSMVGALHDHSERSGFRTECEASRFSENQARVKEHAKPWLFGVWTKPSRPYLPVLYLLHFPKTTALSALHGRVMLECSELRHMVGEIHRPPRRTALRREHFKLHIAS